MQAIYSGDGEWYEATVKGVSDTGDFVVSFDAYEHEETVSTPAPFPCCLASLCVDVIQCLLCLLYAAIACIGHPDIIRDRIHAMFPAGTTRPPGVHQQLFHGCLVMSRAQVCLAPFTEHVMPRSKDSLKILNILWRQAFLTGKIFSPAA